MRNCVVRPRFLVDLPALYEIWYDKRVLDRLPITPNDRRSEWIASRQTPNPHMLSLVCHCSPQLTGFLECSDTGVVHEFCIDSHLQGGHGGIGSLLLDALKIELKSRQIQQIVRTPVRQAVEEAFWLGAGAKKMPEGYVLKL